MSSACRLYVYTNRKEYTWIERVAKKSGTPVSSLVRALIIEKMKEEDSINWDPRPTIINAKS